MSPLSQRRLTSSSSGPSEICVMVAVVVEPENPVDERPPALAVGFRLPLARVPLSVEGVRGDPEANQPQVVVLPFRHFLDAGDPATGTVEADTRDHLARRSPAKPRRRLRHVGLRAAGWPGGPAQVRRNATAANVAAPAPSPAAARRGVTAPRLPGRPKARRGSSAARSKAYRQVSFPVGTCGGRGTVITFNTDSCGTNSTGPTGTPPCQA